jgi:hypothetical protein
VDLRQLFAQQLQISGKESVKDGVLVQLEPGLVRGFDLGWSSHDGGLRLSWILSLFAEMGRLGGWRQIA